MGLYVLYSYPQSFLKKIFSKWEDNTPLRDLLDGNVDGRASINDRNENDFYVVLECSRNSALATMHFLAGTKAKNTEGFSISYDTGHSIGAIALMNGNYLEMIVSGDDLDALARAVAKENQSAEEDDYSEDMVSEWRVAKRDDLQTSFGEYYAKHGHVDELDCVEPFSSLLKVGDEPTFVKLTDAGETAEQLLSQKLDWEDPKSVLI